MSKILVIPDCQVKPEHDHTYLERIGKYIVDKRPDTVVCIGDFADMPSLSSYDVGKKSFEGRRYKADVEASKEAMATLVKPMNDFNVQARKNGKRQYRPRMVLTLGNHEDRIDRVVNSDPKLDGTISIDDLDYASFGWEVHPFLEVVVIDGIAFSHYFISGVRGLPVGTSNLLINKKHMSCIAGHQQGRQVSYGHRADGKRVTAIIAGSCYEHDEDYMGPQGNKHWRGIIVLNEVNDGEFDEMFVSLEFLKGKYK